MELFTESQELFSDSHPLEACISAMLSGHAETWMPFSCVVSEHTSLLRFCLSTRNDRDPVLVLRR